MQNDYQRLTRWQKAAMTKTRNKFFKGKHYTSLREWQLQTNAWYYQYMKIHGLLSTEEQKKVDLSKEEQESIEKVIAEFMKKQVVVNDISDVSRGKVVY